MPLSPDPSAAADFLCAEDASEVTSDHQSPPIPESLSADYDESAIGGLLDAESHHMPEKDYLRRCRDRSVDVTARLDAVNWILKVHAFYQFRPVTAFLCVNYLDRFLSCCTLPRASGWAFQLLSVACLSLAAKMEEPHVPFLLDLQLFEPKFFFEPKTVQRMELWVMANLKWRLSSVTPFHYLHYFISKLPSSSDSVNHFFSTASNLILSTTRVLDFLGFAPSSLAAAAVLCSAGRDLVSANGQFTLTFHDRVNKEMVRCCHQLMEEYVVDTCPASSSTIKASIAEPPPPPSSPVGVLDAATCGSCDTPSERNCAGSSQEQAEPPSKRLRSSTPDAPQR
ncbi:Cyclin-D1-1, partial [Mucuna pruriens]